MKSVTFHLTAYLHKFQLFSSQHVQIALPRQHSWFWNRATACMPFSVELAHPHTHTCSHIMVTVAVMMAQGWWAAAGCGFHIVCVCVMSSSKVCTGSLHTFSRVLSKLSPVLSLCDVQIRGKSKTEEEEEDWWCCSSSPVAVSSVIFAVPEVWSVENMLF